MSRSTPDPNPSTRPSLLWPVFALLAWALLLYQVYVQVPGQLDRLNELRVDLPTWSRWLLENASWVVPVTGLITALLVGWIRQPTGRWLILAIVAVVGLLTFLGIQWLGLLRLMADTGPTGL